MSQVDIGKQKSLKCLLLFPHTGSTWSSLCQDCKFDTWTSIGRKLKKRDICVEFDVVDGGDEEDMVVLFNIFVGFDDDGKVRL